MPNRNARRAVRAPNHEGGRRTDSGFTRVARERPLLVVGLGVALGMILGALLPWDRIDSEFLGEQAEKLKDGALDLANDGYEKVKSTAQSTYSTAAETLGVGKGVSDSGESSKGKANYNDSYGISRS